MAIHFSQLQTAQLHTTSGIHKLELRVAKNFVTRFKGLMLTQKLASASGLLITRCTSVHTCFMRYELDLVYLDRAGRVTCCAAHTKPWRLSWPQRSKNKLKTAHVLELGAGSIAQMRIAELDHLVHPIFNGAKS
jgi:uncharacterized membrane protein (UPF0127 family)